MLAALACTDQPEWHRDITAPSRSNTPFEADPRAVGIDSVLLSISQRVTGFSTIYLDSTATLVIRLKDHSQDAAAEAAVREFLRATGRRESPIRFETADLDFRELNRHTARLRTLSLAMPQAWGLGIDKITGRVEVLTSDEHSLQDIVLEAVRRGVPRSALRVTKMGGPVRTSSIRDWSDPVVGGLMIGFPNSDWHYQDAECTLGYIASLGSVQGFITASHCSKVPFGADGVPQDTSWYVFQPDYRYSSCGSFVQGCGLIRGRPERQIGVEYFDPPAFTNATDAYWCKPGQLCRWSDASFYKIDGPNDSPTLPRGVGMSWIAATISPAATFDTMYTSNPWFQRPAGNESWAIISQLDYPMVGDSVDKMGERTGWSRGAVTRTCYQTSDGSGKLQSNGVFLLCQDYVDGPKAFAWRGDSGSPVFYYNYFPSNPPTVVPVGLAWGKDSIPGQPLPPTGYWMSNLRGIRFDLGSVAIY